MKITDWHDIGSYVTFKYGKEKWEVLDLPGQGLVYTTPGLKLIVNMTYYPTGEFSKKVIEDYRKCNPYSKGGVWEWKHGRWRRLDLLGKMKEHHVRRVKK